MFNIPIAISNITSIIRMTYSPNGLSVILQMTGFFRGIYYDLYCPNAVNLEIVNVPRRTRVLISFFRRFVSFFVISSFFVYRNLVPSPYGVVRLLL